MTEKSERDEFLKQLKEDSLVLNVEADEA